MTSSDNRGLSTSPEYWGEGDVTDCTGMPRTHSGPHIILTGGAQGSHLRHARPVEIDGTTLPVTILGDGFTGGRSDWNAMVYGQKRTGLVRRALRALRRA